MEIVFGIDFYFWPLCCLFFSDIRIMITPLVSSNSSSKVFSVATLCWLTATDYMCRKREPRYSVWSIYNPVLNELLTCHRIIN